MEKIKINGKEINLCFDMGFVREIDKTFVIPVDDNPAHDQKKGLVMAIAGILDGDIYALERVLMYAAERAGTPLTEEDMNKWFSDADTDLERVAEFVLGFFEKTGCCRLQLKKAEQIKAAQTQ